MSTVKYINNKELIAEIQRSKASFCYFISPEYTVFYDAVITSIDQLTPELLANTIKTKAAKLSTKVAVVNPNSIDPKTVTFRVMTDSHLPPETDEKRRRKSSTGEWVAKPNFPPFKHYILDDGKPIEVGRSHWKDGLHNGCFSIDHGRMSNRLAQMFMLLVEQYSHRGNWRGYSYIDEMRCHALMHLSQVGLQFDESRSDNAFDFFTKIVKHCFAGETIILTKEHGSIAIKDVAEQDVHLLDGNGDWVLCHIYDHGIQETQLNYFQGDNQKIGIWSTLKHEWESDGKIIETKDFAGHNTKIDDLRPNKIIKNDENYRKGIIHGLIYGDGHRRSKNSFALTVCSHHESIIPYLTNYPHGMSGKYPVYNIRSSRDNPDWIDLKALPEQPGADLDYLLGFARGWFAADGCVGNNYGETRKNGERPASPCPTLCGDLAEYEWIKKWGPLVGWHLNSYNKLAEKTNFGVRNKISLNFHLRRSSMDVEDFLIEQHRERWLQRAVVKKHHADKKYDWKLIEKRLETTSWTKLAKELAEEHDTSLNSIRSAYCQYRKSKKQKENPKRAWYVYGSKQTAERRLERVFCPVVPTTHSFASGYGIKFLNCFTRILNLEKRNQNIRDDLLLMSGVNPSYTRQVDNEIEQREYEPSIKPNHSEKDSAPKEMKKRGRKPKIKI